MNPKLGDLIRNTGGARKVRHSGKRGQSRVIYYYHMGGGEIFFLACYSKKLRLRDRIKFRIGEMFLTAAMKLLPMPFWEEFVIQMYGGIRGGKAKDAADERHEELNKRLADYLAGRGSGEWPPNQDQNSN